MLGLGGQRTTAQPQHPGAPAAQRPAIQLPHFARPGARAGAQRQGGKGGHPEEGHGVRLLPGGAGASTPSGERQIAGPATTAPPPA